MWVFYHNVTSSAPAGDMSFLIPVSCLALTGIFWFSFLKWVAREDG